MPFLDKGENERQRKIEKASKVSDLEKNPCIKEHAMSLKCLSDHNFDRDKCSKYFKNYTLCRDFWLHVQVDRKKKGIKPELPPISERADIMIQYKNWIPT